MAAPLLGQAAPLLGQAAPLIGQAAPLLGQAAPLLGQAAPPWQVLPLIAIAGGLLMVVDALWKRSQARRMP